MIKRWLRNMIREEVNTALKDRKEHIKVRINSSQVENIVRREIDKSLAAFADSIEKHSKKK